MVIWHTIALITTYSQKATSSHSTPIVMYPAPWTLSTKCWPSKGQSYVLSTWLAKQDQNSSLTYPFSRKRIFGPSTGASFLEELKLTILGGPKKEIPYLKYGSTMWCMQMDRLSIKIKLILFGRSQEYDQFESDSSKFKILKSHYEFIDLLTLIIIFFLFVIGILNFMIDGYSLIEI